MQSIPPWCVPHDLSFTLKLALPLGTVGEVESFFRLLIFDFRLQVVGLEALEEVLL